MENEFHVCVRVYGVGGRGKSLSGRLRERRPGEIEHEITRGHDAA